MNRRRTLLATLALAASAAALAGLARLQPQREGERPACVAWSGPDSKITARRFERIRDEQTWLKVWGDHAGQDETNLHFIWQTAPRIDFARFEVVACFRGTAVNSNGERVVGLEDTGGGLRIRFEGAWYQTASFDGSGGARASVPYGIWVIDRTDKPIIVEENVQGLIGHPPDWKEQKRFAAP